MNFWKGKKVFITGGNGFIGSWIVKKLIQKKAKIFCLVYEKIPYSIYNLEKFKKHVTQIPGDVKNYKDVLQIIKKNKIDIVLHLAAEPIVQNANKKPIHTFKTNITGTWNILEAIRNTNTVKACVIASSDKAYGEHKHLPYSERVALHGEHPYSVSKSCADLISRAYYLTYKLPVTITRCGNIYGWGDSNYSRIVPAAILSGLTDRELVLRSDGTFVREYLYVEDIADAYLKLAEKTSKNEKIWGQAFNFGEEKAYSVNDIIKRIEKILKKKIQVKLGSHKLNEIRKQYLSDKKESKLIGWKPKHSIDRGLKKTIQQYKKNLSLFKNGNRKNTGICLYH